MESQGYELLVVVQRPKLEYLSLAKVDETLLAIEDLMGYSRKPKVQGHDEKAF